MSKASRTRRLEGAHRSRDVDIIAADNAAERDTQDTELVFRTLLGMPHNGRRREPADHRPSGQPERPVTTFHLGLTIPVR